MHWVRTCVAVCAVLSSLLHAEKIEKTFTILSVNDVYEVDAKREVGGLAELASLIQQEKAKAKTSVVTLNGDFLSPSLLSTHFHGTHMVEIMNRLPVDFVVFGNHEFDFGTEILKSCMDLSSFQWFGANVLTKEGELFHSAVKEKIIDYDGVKIGFFGVVTPETKKLSSGGGEVEFSAVIPAAKEAVRSLNTQGADVIVALTHLTIEEDEALAKEVQEVDLILGGHEHFPFTKQVGKTLIHKSGCDAHYLVRFDLHIQKWIDKDRQKHVRVVPEWSMKANYQGEKDPQLAKTIAHFQKEMDHALGEVVAQSQSPLCSHSSCVRSRETAIGNLFADAIRQAYQTDAVILNGGTIRGEYEYEAGHFLTKKDILRELPFANGCCVIDLTGEELVSVLEFGLSCANQKKGGFPQVSGIRLSYEQGIDGSVHIHQLQVGEDPVDSERVYQVAVSDYMSQGGDGYEMLQAKVPDDFEGDGNILYAIVCSYLSHHPKVSPGVEGRLQLYQEEQAAVASLDAL